MFGKMCVRTFNNDRENEILVVRSLSLSLPGDFPVGAARGALVAGHCRSPYAFFVVIVRIFGVLGLHPTKIRNTRK